MGISAVRSLVLVTMAAFSPAVVGSSGGESARPVVIVDIDQVRAVLIESGLLDARGMETYLEGHIPQAFPADLEALEDAVLSDPDPDTAKVLRVLARVPLSPTHPAIVYDATRQGRRDGYLAWLLAYAGVPQVQILDGGFAAWNRRRGFGVFRGHPMPRGRIRLRPEDLQPRPDLRVKAAEIREATPAGAVLLTVLPPASGDGEAVPGPGALRSAEVLAPDGRFLYPFHLRNLLTSRGVDPDARLLLQGPAAEAGLVWAALAGNGFDAALVTGGDERAAAARFPVGHPLAGKPPAVLHGVLARALR